MSKQDSNVKRKESQVISGIYKIENLINHKVYIGQSKDIYRRWNHHRCTIHNKNIKGYNYSHEFYWKLIRF